MANLVSEIAWNNLLITYSLLPLKMNSAISRSSVSNIILLSCARMTWSKTDSMQNLTCWWYLSQNNGSTGWNERVRRDDVLIFSMKSMALRSTNRNHTLNFAEEHGWKNKHWKNFKKKRKKNCNKLPFTSGVEILPIGQFYGYGLPSHGNRH